MTKPFKIQAKVRFQTSYKGKKVLKNGAAPTQAPQRGRVPRVTRLLALAHRFEKLIRDGVVRDDADLSRLGHVTRARLSQIMDLLRERMAEKILVFGGGVIPPRDVEYLKHLGVAEVFTPGASARQIVSTIQHKLNAARSAIRSHEVLA